MTIATVEATVDSGSIRIHLSGEIDLANAADVEEEILDAVSDEPTAVSVDLADLTYLDSAGIRILFHLASRLQDSGIVLQLIVPLDSRIRELIELSGFESLATLHPASN
jgi:anti-anti-sigma factor